MHLGHYNPMQMLVLYVYKIKSLSEESDLGVVISDDLKISKQCIDAIKKKNNRF